MLNDGDRRVLRRYQASPESGVPELAEATGLSPARVTRRLEKLREAGVVQGVGIVIDWRALGFDVEVSLRITLDKTQARAFDDFLIAVRSVPEVVEIQTFLGRVDVRLSVIAQDLEDYQRVYRNDILTLPHIADIEALMTIARVKNEAGLPI